MKQIWKVEKEYSSLRLDLAVSKKFEDISRSFAREKIQTGEIKLNNENVKASVKVFEGDRVAIDYEQTALETKLEPTPLNFEIVYEDEHLICIDKPAGLVVHPGAGREEETVVSSILSHTQLSSIGSPNRPGVVQRLDKETSGLMVLAKTDKAHHQLVKQFSQHSVKKEYLAIIQGAIENQKGRIEVAIERDRVHRKRMKATSEKNARLAVSRFEVVEYLDESTLIKVEILTGRTHQIRVHMSFTGHPLLGDTLYGARKKPFSHFLHSYKLELEHPVTGHKLQFYSQIPESFKNKIIELNGKPVTEELLKSSIG